MINPLKFFYHNILPLGVKDKVEQWREPRRQTKNLYSQAYCATRSVFIHIPKTAGTSVSQALYGGQPWHHTARSYYQADPERFRQFFSFAFVRNPWDRLLSTYHYACKISDPVYRGPLSSIAKCQNFEAFVMTWCNAERINEHYFLKPQFDYLTLDDQQIGVDYVGRFETLNQSFAHICEQLSVKAELPSLNQSKGKTDFRESYTPAMVDKVASLYDRDIKSFHYAFE
ncbi:sulfotransferase family protein [Aestuariibacter halophilus]|uniref:Sulfotransferase family protein n=1 Tax=Fluctibacter halophilus TaxID=226011 RepID=A0ABS8GCQ0_9ALTE|nr:sulfotransferase family 2 domain-containing protein [Aestuariibacter halophilus]MCC2618340.1 sulfotransferase family protein [Aestuariibacter halophilus]